MATLTVFIFVLGFLIFIHELGHFAAAKMVGVGVQEFSVGFPPKIVSKTIRGTEYMLSLIPLGGYVRLKGQNIDDEDPNERDNYAAKSPFKRFFILVAGSAMNLSVSLVFVPLALYIGHDVPAFFFDPPVLRSVEQNGSAQKAGFKAGDRIVAVNRQPVANWQETQRMLASSQSETIPITLMREERRVLLTFDRSLLASEREFGWSFFIKPIVGSAAANSPAERAGMGSGDVIVRIGDVPIGDWSEITSAVSSGNGREIKIQFLRDGSLRTVSVIPYRDRQDSRWIIGINSATVTVSETVWNSISGGLKWVTYVTRSTFEFLYRLIVGQASSKSIGGPIMIAQMVGEAAERGVSDLLQMVGFISLQLCIFNLLPIPALDGGHIFLLLLEKMKGSGLSKGFRITVQKAGFVLLMTLITLVLVQDGYRVFEGF